MSYYKKYRQISPLCLPFQICVPAGRRNINVLFLPAVDMTRGQSAIRVVVVVLLVVDCVHWMRQYKLGLGEWSLGVLLSQHPSKKILQSSRNRVDRTIWLRKIWTGKPDSQYNIGLHAALGHWGWTEKSWRGIHPRTNPGPFAIVPSGNRATSQVSRNQIYSDGLLVVCVHEISCS